MLGLLVVTALLSACDDEGRDGGGPRPSDPSPSACDTAVPAADLVPTRGAWFGVSIDWEHDSLADYADRLGRAPAVAVTFTSLPMSEIEIGYLDAAVDQADEAGSMLLVTLEPRHGLAAVTTEVARDLAARLRGYNDRGAPVFVRFAHEMNGSWYSWGQQPRQYVAAFRRVAAAVHELAPGSAMMWAPNYGGGYPFAGGAHQAVAGTAAAEALDTDGDGAVTRRDDPYAPYWPGRAAVDWVGMSLYHWGNKYPWGENEVPEPGKFDDLLRGTYRGLGGDERGVPDFYAVYGAGQRRPVAITETAALYVPGRPGPDPRTIKQAWWRQVFAATRSERLPWLKMVNWFEWKKLEPEVNGVADWTATRDRPVRTAFRADLPGWARYATDVPGCPD
jgi:hypothetical protein